MRVAPDWFIAARVRRLRHVIVHLPTTEPGTHGAQLVNELRRTIEGPRHEIPQLVDVLAEFGLLHTDANRIRLNRKGQRAATLSDPKARRELAGLIIQTGFLHSQMRLVMEAASRDDDGTVRARIGPLRRSAPQLLGLLRAWPGVVGPSFLEIPAELFASLDTPWSLIPLPQPDDGTKKAVGSRAEAYSYQFLRLQAEHPGTVTWVARDDESLGYDIEDRSRDVTQRVEVKASQQSGIRFFLSENEHTVAHRDPTTYEVHFWGEINLHCDPNTEYGLLRAQGFPLIFEDLAAYLEDGRLEAVPTKYRVTPGNRNRVS